MGGEGRGKQDRLHPKASQPPSSIPSCLFSLSCSQLNNSLICSSHSHLQGGASPSSPLFTSLVSLGCSPTTTHPWGLPLLRLPRASASPAVQQQRPRTLAASRRAGPTDPCKLLSNPRRERQSMINMTIYFAGVREVKVEVLRHIFDLAN